MVIIISHLWLHAYATTITLRTPSLCLVIVVRHLAIAMIINNQRLHIRVNLYIFVETG